MDLKILIGILLLIGIVGVGIAVAHGNSETSDDSGTGDIAEMMGDGDRGMSGMMNNGEMEEMMNSGMMNNSMPMMSMMMGNMEEMMEDPEFREEMLEHMKDCPMMKNYNS